MQIADVASHPLAVVPPAAVGVANSWFNLPQFINVLTVTYLTLQITYFVYSKYKEFANDRKQRLTG